MGSRLPLNTTDSHSMVSSTVSPSSSVTTSTDNPNSMLLMASTIKAILSRVILSSKGILSNNLNNSNTART